MTPAIVQLKQQKVTFFLHQYQHEESAASYGLEAADKLNLNPEQVFKTLVIEADSQLSVAIIPVNKQLSLKHAAKALHCKKAIMADAQKVEKTTGYVLGGVSPLGQKKPLTTLIDSSVQSFNTIFVSGGKRGLEIELSPNDLQKLTNAKLVDIGA